MVRCTTRLRRLVAMMALLAWVLGALPARADEASATGDKGTDMVVDLVVLRPLGLVATVLGAVGFVVSLPFTVPSGSVEETAHELVARPAEYTFSRPLGDLYHCGAERHPCGER